MKKIDELKEIYLPNGGQLILLNKEGRTIESCNALFNFTSDGTEELFDKVPFVESVWSTIEEMHEKDPMLKYPKINIDLAGSVGVYDMGFSIIGLDKEETVVWTLVDISSPVEKVRNVQQTYNFGVIEDELVDAYDKLISLEKKIIDTRKLEINRQMRLKSNYVKMVNHEIATSLGLSNRLLEQTKQKDMPADELAVIVDYTIFKQHALRKNLVYAEEQLDTPSDLRLASDKVDIRVLLSSIINTINFETHSKSVIIDANVSDLVPQNVIVDGERLKAMVYNAFDFFIEHLKDTKLELGVTFEAEEEAGELQFILKCPKTVLPSYLFAALSESYGESQQVNSNSSATFGLPLAKYLSKSISGYMGVRKEKDGGHYIVVRIPVKNT